MKKIFWHKPNTIKKRTKNLILKELMELLPTLNLNETIVEIKFELSNQDIRRAYIQNPKKYNNPEFVSKFDSFSIKNSYNIYEIDLRTFEIRSYKMVYEY